MNINEIEKEIERLQNLLIEEKNKYKLPRLENQTYYYVTNISFTNSIGLGISKDIGCNYDNSKYNNFDYFTDKDKAQKYADHIRLELELFQIRDMVRDGWIPDWDNKETDKHCIGWYINKKVDQIIMNGVGASLSFQTEEKLKHFIDLVGEEKIKQYLSF